MSFAQPAAFETSLATPERFASGCNFRISRMAASTRACPLPLTITDTDSAASARADAKPIPAVEPVTNALLPSSCRSMSPFSNQQHAGLLLRFIFNEAGAVLGKLAYFRVALR